jgi:hypothetical protein
MSHDTYGFADAHSVLLGYEQCMDEADARSRAHAYAEQRGEAIEYWRDARDADGEPLPSKTVQPTSVAHRAR